MSVTVMAMPERPVGGAARRGAGVVGFAVDGGVVGLAAGGGVDGFAVAGGVWAGRAGAGAWAYIATEPAITKLISKSRVRIPAI